MPATTIDLSIAVGRRLAVIPDRRDDDPDRQPALEVRLGPGPVLLPAVLEPLPSRDGRACDAPELGVGLVDVEHVLGVPPDVLGPPGLGADVVLAEDATGGQKQREPAVGPFLGGHIRGGREHAETAYERALVHDRRTQRLVGIARPLHAAHLVEHRERHARKRRCQLGDLVHDLARLVVVHWSAERCRQLAGHFPFLLPRA